MTIAGLDPSGGAGIIADIKTFFAFGCFPTAAVASITYQNTVGVFGSESQSAASVRSQAVPVIEDIGVDSLKTGMLPTREIILETAKLVREFGLKKLVIDPVVRSTTGFDLIDNVALTTLIEHLFPLSDIVTPNIQEAERITGIAIETIDDIEAVAELMSKFGAKNILIKGGHLPKSINDRSCPSAIDYLFLDGVLLKFEAPYIETTATHGTGCTLAAAIAANLALGKNLIEAVEISKEFVNRAIQTAPMLGKGNSPINVQPI